MTREEAIEVLKNTEDNINYDTKREEIYFTHKWVGAYEMAIAALREQGNCCKNGNSSKTNADHIRAMSDEELEEFLRNSLWGRKQNARLFALKEWLKQPYEEDTHD